MTTHAKNLAISTVADFLDIKTRIVAAEEADDVETENRIMEQEVQERPYGVQVRSDWHTPGSTQRHEQGEYLYTLAGGGPALRLIGDFDGGYPYTGRLEYQDWGTGWTPLREHDLPDDLKTALVSHGITMDNLLVWFAEAQGYLGE